jgi:hypothetical protein
MIKSNTSLAMIGSLSANFRADRWRGKVNQGVPTDRTP